MRWSVPGVFGVWHRTCSPAFSSSAITIFAILGSPNLEVHMPMRSPAAGSDARWVREQWETREHVLDNNACWSKNAAGFDFKTFSNGERRN